MTNRALLLLAIFALFLGGGALGYFARRYGERVALPPARVRTPELRSRLDEYERGDRPRRARSDHDVLVILKSGSREDRAEAQLLWGLSVEGTRGLESVERHYPDSQAAGRALWEAILRTEEGPRRQDLLAFFRRRHPNAWVLRGEAR